MGHKKIAKRDKNKGKKILFINKKKRPIKPIIGSFVREDGAQIYSTNEDIL